MYSADHLARSLEPLVDNVGVLSVVTALAAICRDKWRRITAQHGECSPATAWLKAARDVEHMARDLDKELLAIRDIAGWLEERSQS
jgi:hypothetical protein